MGIVICLQGLLRGQEWKIKFMYMWNIKFNARFKVLLIRWHVISTIKLYIYQGFPANFVGFQKEFRLSVYGIEKSIFFRALHIYAKIFTWGIKNIEKIVIGQIFIIWEKKTQLYILSFLPFFNVTGIYEICMYGNENFMWNMCMISHYYHCCLF